MWILVGSDYRLGPVDLGWICPALVGHLHLLMSNKDTNLMGARKLDGETPMYRYITVVKHTDNLLLQNKAEDKIRTHDPKFTISSL